MKKYLLTSGIIFCVLFLYSQHTGYVLQKDSAANSSTYEHYNSRITSYIYNCNYNSHNDSIFLNDIKERALLMSNIKWVPKHDIPNNINRFDKGKTISGLPYSSVKELQKFIGLDVSIYTFLTAVDNPYSLLYTEDVAKGNPCYLGGAYNGKNSHTFYGTVCSSFTAFCFGENNNYTSFNYRNGQVPNYYLKPDQSIEKVSPGDLFWCPGHVALITEVEKDNSGKIKAIQLLESAGDKVYTRNYTESTFFRRMSGNFDSKKKAFLYRNKLIGTSSNKSVDNLTNKDINLVLTNLPINNQEICTWFGDRPCLGEWDRLMINFNKKNYNKIIISLNNEIIDTLDISNAEHSIEYKYKSKGLYKAQLASDSIVSSNYTSFEVIDTSTKVHHNDDGTLEIIFADNSNPEIVYWVNKAGDQHTFPTTVPEKAKIEGKMIFEPCDKKDAILRVIYRGSYGRAINKPDHLFKNAYPNNNSKN